MKTIKFLLNCFLLCSILFCITACTNSPTIDNKCEHQYIEFSTTDSTCSQEGEKIYKCLKCDNHKSVAIEKKAHKYNSTITSQATCGQEGIETFTCENCNEYYTVNIPKLENHTYSKNNVCKGCGKNTQIKLTMTEDEKKSALTVVSANVLILQQNDYYEIKTTLKNESNSNPTNSNTVVVPFIFDYVITDKNGNMVCSDVVGVDTNDFSIYDEYGTMWASIKIPYSKLSNHDLDKIYVTCYNPGYFMRGEASLSMPMTISLPTMPQTVSYTNYSGTSVLEITSISISYSTYFIRIYLSGKCIIHAGASNVASYKAISYRIKDSTGTIIETDNIYTPSITKDETFKNVEILLATSDFESGKTYTLELINSTK